MAGVILAKEVFPGREAVPTRWSPRLGYCRDL